MLTEAIIVWVLVGGIRTGSDRLPVEICQRELAGLAPLYAADRSNYGQKTDDPRTWVSHGYCMLVAPR